MIDQQFGIFLLVTIGIIGIIVPITELPSLYNNSFLVVLGVLFILVVLFLDKCRNWRHPKKGGTRTASTRSSGSQRTSNEDEKPNLSEKILACKAAPRIELSYPDKDVEAGLPQPPPIATIYSDTSKITPQAGNLNLYGISHPYTSQSASKSVEDFTNLIKHINQADRLGRGPFLSAFQDSEVYERGPDNEKKVSRRDRPVSLLLPATSSNSKQAPEYRHVVQDSDSSTPNISHFSWNDQSGPSTPLHFSRLGRSVAHRIDSWISVPKEKRTLSIRNVTEDPDYMAELPSPPRIKKHMTTLSDVSVYSYGDAQTTTLSRGNTVIVHAQPGSSIENSTKF